MPANQHAAAGDDRDVSEAKRDAEDRRDAKEKKREREEAKKREREDESRAKQAREREEKEARQAEKHRRKQNDAAAASRGKVSVEPPLLEDPAMPMRDLALGTVIMGAVIAAWFLYKSQPLRARRCKAMNRSLSCPALVELQSKRALKACANMMLAFDERKSSRKPAPLPLTPLLPALSEAAGETSQDWTPMSTPQGSPRCSPRTSPRVSRRESPRQARASFERIPQPPGGFPGPLGPFEVGSGSQGRGHSGESYPSPRQSRAASPRCSTSSPPPDATGDLQRVFVPLTAALGREEAEAPQGAAGGGMAGRPAPRAAVGGPGDGGGLTSADGWNVRRARNSREETAAISYDEMLARAAATDSSPSCSPPPRATSPRQPSPHQQAPLQPAPLQSSPLKPSARQPSSQPSARQPALPELSPPHPHLVVLGDAGVGVSSVVLVLERFAASHGVKLAIGETVPTTREGLASAVPLVVWDAVDEARGSLKDYVQRHVGGLTQALTRAGGTAKEAEALEGRLLVLCNKTDVEPCPLPAAVRLALSPRCACACVHDACACVHVPAAVRLALSPRCAPLCRPAALDPPVPPRH